MTVKDHSSPPISFFEHQRQASIERGLVIAAGMRAAMRATTKWLRMLVLRSIKWREAWLPNDATAAPFVRSSGSTIVC
jgi:hypothetical protein